MAKLTRQRLQGKGVSYIKVASVLIATIFIMNLSIKLMENLNPLLSSAVALMIVGLGGLYIYNVVFYSMANYIYKIISKELIIERIISTSNHTFYNIDFNDIKVFEPFNPENDNMKVSRKFKYVLDKDYTKWYFIEFTRDGNVTKLIIEPELGLVKSIQERLMLNENS
ncbi:MAG: hypothetical protein JW702_00625 [Clostridiales bacterium]|nr:hypothetical protein [Clostridiales bacterium]